MRRSQCLIVLLLLLVSCEKYYLSVTREAVDRARLASTFVKSPDPRQESPPKGQELTIEWRLPEKDLEEGLTLVLSIIYKNHSQETICYPVNKRRGVITYSLIGEEYKQTEGLLTYKVEILQKDNLVLKEWKQQLWTELIVLD
jgi:hypothetical protein